MEEKLKNIATEENTSFTDIVDVVYLTPENSSFSVKNERFLHLVSDIDVKPDFLPGEEERRPPRIHHGPGGPGGHPHHTRRPPRKKEIKYTEEGRRDYGRVILHRAFPFDNPTRIISVQDEDGNEIGVIRDLADFDGDTRKSLEKHLDSKYFVPEITRIASAKDRFGFLYCRCETNCGECEFVIRNPYVNIFRTGKNRIFIVDIDGNRYSIGDVRALDKRSLRKIELYL